MSCSGVSAAGLPLIRPFHPTVVRGYSQGPTGQLGAGTLIPTACVTHLFKVDAHDDQQVFGALVGVGLEELGVFQRGTNIVNGARADDLPNGECP